MKINELRTTHGHTWTDQRQFRNRKQMTFSHIRPLNPMPLIYCHAVAFADAGLPLPVPTMDAPHRAWAYIALDGFGAIDGPYEVHLCERPFSISFHAMRDAWSVPQMPLMTRQGTQT